MNLCHFMTMLNHRNQRIAAFIIFVLFISIPFYPSVTLSDAGSTQDVSNSKFVTDMDRQIQNLMTEYSVPGVGILIIKQGEIFWKKAYGFADIERKRKLTIDAICRAESISKSVTAWGVMKLAERGLVHLDDPVQKHLGSWTLPESNYDTDGITIRRLLSHSAGIPLGTLGDEYAPMSLKPPLKEYLTKEVQISYKPGSRFEYSNPGFNLLELLIEEVTKRDFNEYMVDEVLKPLGMNSSNFDWDESWSARVPMGYDLNGDPVQPYVYPYSASGGLLSTVGDIARFVMAEMTLDQERQAKVLSIESIHTILSPQVKTSGIFDFVSDGYGFGHFIETLPDGKKAVWSGGQGHGWMTHFHLIPETGDGIVIFTNSQRSWPLIAHILSTWSLRTDHGLVKFSRIKSLVVVLWVFTGALFLLAFILGARTLYGIATNKRRWSFTLIPSHKTRIIEFLLWLTLTFALLWAVNQEYLFLTSIFPAGIFWLGWGVLLLSLVLLLSITFPTKEVNNYPSSSLEVS